MFIPDPGSWFLLIPDPGYKDSNKREGLKNICCENFLGSHKFHKIVNYFSFEVLKKKMWANFQRIIELFTKKIVKKLLKNGLGIRDPGSGKNLYDKYETNAQEFFLPCWMQERAEEVNAFWSLVRK